MNGFYCVAMQLLGCFSVARVPPAAQVYGIFSRFISCQVTIISLNSLISSPPFNRSYDFSYYHVSSTNGVMQSDNYGQYL